MRLLLAPLFSLCALGFSGCQNVEKMFQPEKPAEKPPPDPAESLIGKVEKTPKLVVAKIIVKIPDGAEVGEVRTAIMQSQRHPLVWGPSTAPKQGELIGVATTRLHELGYKVEGHDSELFGASRMAADHFVLGAIIDRFALTIDQVSCTQTFNIVVEWQLFDSAREKVVYSRTVTDSAVERKGTDPVLLPAFKRTLDAVATDDAFIAALLEPARKIEPTVSGDELVIECDAAAPPGSSFSFEDAKQSVVTVIAGTSSGSGVFVSRGGLLLTAAHVVGGGKQLTVELSSRVRLPATVIRIDSDADVALLQVTGAGFQPARYSAQPLLQPGNDVFVVGSPLGDTYALSVSRGVVSGIRKINGVEYVQTDAAINHGNSGGPMFDGAGNLIGIVALKPIDPNAGVNQTAEGIGLGVSLQQASRSLRFRFAPRIAGVGK